jgi:hypothetical protein
MGVVLCNFTTKDHTHSITGSHAHHSIATPTQFEVKIRVLGLLSISGSSAMLHIVDTRKVTADPGTWWLVGCILKAKLMYVAQ